ncbi:T20D4.11-like domain-containing protein [Caenorhabditis elegans]|uniref:T20D4.11-like domain-containing protein n=1 Tax=Caenorhabditis elegans TaxID=6239 RepID=A0A8S5IA68_CAEEL|nr:DUF19 domain-containing protein [Caenorhabditis elegans]CCD73664.2 DUF19 domain-containing protein [Caenorhabditis elegans]
MCRKLTVFMAILIFVTATCEALDCTNPEVPETTKCLEIFKELGENIIRLDISNKTGPTKVIEICINFNRCRQTLDCQPDKVFAIVVNTGLMFCEYAQFFLDTFVPCQVKIDAKASECSKNWDPYPSEISDKEKMAKIHKEACDNLFGKDNCLEKEITETCGVEMWKGFRKNTLAMKTFMGTCKFGEEITIPK